MGQGVGLSIAFTIDSTSIPNSKLNNYFFVLAIVSRFIINSPTMLVTTPRHDSPVLSNPSKYNGYHSSSVDYQDRPGSRRIFPNPQYS